MTAVDNKTPDLLGSTISKYAYTYDALGRRDDRTQSGSNVNNASTDDFDYNPRSEITDSINSAKTETEWNSDFDYDKIGNRKSASGGALPTTPVAYLADSTNQYDSVGGVLWHDPNDPTKGYDDDGNFIGDGIWQYTWNNENRLSSATNGTITIDFTYDYQGRLVKKDDGTDVVVYVYDGWNRIATFEVETSTFDVQRSYLWGLDLSGTMQGAGGVGGLLRESDVSYDAVAEEYSVTDPHYPLYDANGNIMQKLDGTGTVQMSVDYDPFGNIIAITGSFEGEYGFSTKPLIADLNWYYYGFRYYDPTTGRWPNRDPIDERGGLNLYGFVGNNAIKFVDINGQLAWWVGPGIGIWIGVNTCIRVRKI